MAAKAMKWHDWMAAASFGALAIGGFWSVGHYVFTGAVPPPVLEFSGQPVASDIRDGRVTITYLLRRNEACPTTAHIRWYDLDSEAFDVGSARTVESTQALVTAGFEPFSITLAVPPGIARPVYAPTFIPGPDCRSEAIITAPWAEVRR